MCVFVCICQVDLTHKSDKYEFSLNYLTEINAMNVYHYADPYRYRTICFHSINIHQNNANQPTSKIEQYNAMHINVIYGMISIRSYHKRCASSLKFN